MAGTFVPLVNGAQVRIVGIQAGQTIENVFYVLFPSAPGPGDIHSLAVDFDNWWSTDVLTILGSGYSYVQTVATDWSSSSGPQDTVAPPSPIPGTSSGTTLNTTLAIVCSLKTGLRGRSFRGRTYLAGVDGLGMATPNTLLPIYLAAVDAAMLAIPGFGGVGPYDFVVASFFSGKDPITGKPKPRASGIGTEVAAIVVQPVLGNQRRRRVGRGI